MSLQRQLLTRSARQQYAVMSRRTFITPTAVRQGTSHCAFHAALMADSCFSSGSRTRHVSAGTEELQATSDETIRR